MDGLHFHEIKIVEFVQKQFSGFDSTLLLVSHLGGPNNAFLIYFPVVYFVSEAIGLKILWAAVFSEWFNMTLKWLLFGHRPYWWVRETKLYNDQNRPDVEQFPSTCETGAGSPSGHMMVTAAVWFIIVRALIRHLRQSRGTKGSSTLAEVLLWTCFGVFMASVGIARLFIATHFPNQVVLGLIIGMLIGNLVFELPVHSFTVLNYFTGSMFLLQAVFYQYFIMYLMGLKPDWSIALAAKWCADKAWVHLNTTPFYSVSRDIGTLFFAGLSKHYIRSKVDTTTRSLAVSVVLGLATILMVHAIDMVMIPTKYAFLFYVLGALKEGLVPITIIGVSVLYEKVFGKEKIG
ncbi:Glucose-6-phosphatase 2 [Holothuria leucospilota]|uniref:Glucose-6-phosphatase n=1 Tax=Holothuria leucospilota TaxID=206669 RepID=A0A9Q1BZY1_HOLLE|nr:Glucose-6-phosphatase 2 [Holothuria leucospilota]